MYYVGSLSPMTGRKITLCGSTQPRCTAKVHGPASAAGWRRTPPAVLAISSLVPLPATRPRLTSSRCKIVANTASGGGGVDLDALGLAVPAIDAADIPSYQAELGAEFDDNGVAVTFRNTERVIEALASGVALADRSHWGRLSVSGSDRLSLLHGQSTADMQALAPGTGCDTVFVTATGRCIDVATALVLSSSILLLVSPGMAPVLAARLQRVIFPADDAAVVDVSSRTRMLTLLGPQAEDVLKELAGDAFTLAGAQYGSHQLLGFGRAGRAPVVVVASGGLATVPGYTLIADEEGAADLYAVLINKGCVPMGEADWERARVTQGRPAVGSELTDDVNALEAGLSHAISLTKGCYIGQETLAKLTNTAGVKQQLWGLQLSGRAAPGRPVKSVGGGEVLGRVTSTVNLEGAGHFALAYLRCRRGSAVVQLRGIDVEVDGAAARVVELPYPTHELPRTAVVGRGAAGAAGLADDDAPAAAAAGGGLAERAAAAKEAREAEKAAAAAAKADRLKAMQARLEAFQAAQQLQKEQQPEQEKQ